MSQVVKKVVLSAFVAAWMTAVGAGVIALADYASRPGAEATVSAVYPDDAPVALDPNASTIVVALHPKCPCSRATVEELAGLVAADPGRARVVALVYAPADAPDAWAHTDLWDRAAAIPGATVVADRGGDEARRFGARTSGETLVYGPDGTLRFAGGVTAGRGHLGGNAGIDAATAVVEGRTPDVRHAPVFGCALDDPDRS